MSITVFPISLHMKQIFSSKYLDCGAFVHASYQQTIDVDISV